MFGRNQQLAESTQMMQFDNLITKTLRCMYETAGQTSEYNNVTIHCRVTTV